MSSSERRVLFWDVETAPTLAYVWEPRTEYVGREMWTHDSFMLTWAAKWRGEDKVFSRRLTSGQAKEQDDRDMVLALAALIRRADVIVAHNGDKFDLRVLRTRLALLDEEPLGPVETIDTYKWARSTFKFAYNRLDYLGEVLTGAGKMKHSGFDLWKRAYMGEPAALREMQEYNQRDVVLLEEVFTKLYPHAHGVPRLAITQGDACAHCGAGREHLIRKGKWVTSVHTYQRYQCKRCKRFSRSRNAFTQGGRRPLNAPIR